MISVIILSASSPPGFPLSGELNQTISSTDIRWPAKSQDDDDDGLQDGDEGGGQI